MIIDRVTVYNWRGLHGRQQVFLANPEDHKERNVTLIRAQNGVGKTSLLAAINWCFFKQSPVKDGDPDGLVNRYALEESENAQTSVEVIFNYEGTKYRAKRSKTGAGATGTVTALQLQEIQEGGDVDVNVGNPDDFIRKVIPEEMSSHFFFFGETPQELASELAQNRFGKAVRDILGSSVAKLALEDLRRAERDFDREAAKLVGADTEAIQTKIDEIDSSIAILDNREEQLKEEKNKSTEIYEALTRDFHKLNNVAETHKKLNRKVDSLRLKIQSDTRQVLAKKKENAKWLANNGAALLSDRLIESVSKALETEAEEIGIPGPYNEKFVHQVLDSEKCVCGRPLVPGSSEIEHVQSLLHKAGDQTVQSRIVYLQTAVERLRTDNSSAWQAKEAIEDDIRYAESNIAQAQVDLKDAEDELKGSDDVIVADIATKKNAARKQQSDATSNLAKLEVKRDSLTSERSRLHKELETAVRHSHKAKSVNTKRRLATALVNRLEEQLSEAEEHARNSIQKTVSDIADKFYMKDVTVRISSNYSMTVLDGDKPIGQSTGEAQMLGLAFTAALASYAKERRKSNHTYLLPGTIAPLIIDSPFGQLDSSYRRAVAQFLPQLAGQVVLLLSDSQATEEVLEEIEPYIGCQYVLTLHSKTSDTEGKQRSIPINGNHYDLSKFNSSFNGAEVVSVK